MCDSQFKHNKNVGMIGSRKWLCYNIEYNWNEQLLIIPGFNQKMIIEGRPLI